MTKNKSEIEHKIFLINGPPSCGKDTIARHVAATNKSNWGIMKFATPIKEAVAHLYGITQEQQNKIEADEKLKDKKSDLFFGMSYREAIIDLSENYFKKIHGKDVFGKNMLNRIKSIEYSANILISDSGFTCEAVPIIEAFGADNVFHIKLERSGCTFENDSREYIDAESLGIETFTIVNRDIRKFLVEGHGIITRLGNHTGPREAFV